MAGAFDKLAAIRSELPELAPQERSERSPREDEFLTVRDVMFNRRKGVSGRLRTVRSELAELFREKRWQEILDLFTPVAEKEPDIVEAEKDIPVREKVAFAFGQLGRFDEAIAELSLCVGRDPHRFGLHNSLAYTAYNSLFAAKNGEVFLSGKERQARIELAHKHFLAAQGLRPDGVTNFYRQGMLYRKIENKAAKALFCFKQAVANWDALSPEEQSARHQEGKNFVKSLYQLAAVLLDEGKCALAAEMLKRCMAVDEESDHISRLHKYFALGKIEYQAGRYQEARHALRFAEKCAGRQPIDYVHELLARTFLGMDQPARALEAIAKVPERQRRPYVHWTEAEALCAQERFEKARQVLKASTERDRLSRHKGLLRLCKIDYLLADYRAAMDHARVAERFYRDKWCNPYTDGLFWLAISALRAGETETARRATVELREHFPAYPKLERLEALFKNGGGAR